MLDAQVEAETVLEVNNIEVIYNHVILVLKGVSLGTQVRRLRQVFVMSVQTHPGRVATIHREDDIYFAVKEDENYLSAYTPDPVLPSCPAVLRG